MVAASVVGKAASAVRVFRWSPSVTEVTVRDELLTLMRCPTSVEVNEGPVTRVTTRLPDVTLQVPLTALSTWFQVTPASVVLKSPQRFEKLTSSNAA